MFADDHSDDFSFGTGFCLDADYNVANIVDAVETQAGAANVLCNNQAADWAMCAQLVADSADYWCADSDGTAKQVTGKTCKADGTGDFTSTTYSCPQSIVYSEQIIQKKRNLAKAQGFVF